MGVRGRRPTVSSAALAAAFTFAAVVLLVTLLSRPVENLFRDILSSTASPFVNPGNDIVIVTVTEGTLAELPYRSPVDRGFLADVVEQIDRVGPRAIGIDILFDSRTEQVKDERLAVVLQSARSPLVIAHAGLSDGLTAEQVSYLQSFAPSVKRGLAVLSRDPTDGVVRDFFPGREQDGIWQPALSQALATIGGLRPQTERAPLAYSRTDQGTPHRFPTYPAESIGLLPPDWLSGKFVLIGADLPAEDRHLTPFAALDGVEVGSLPGVIIHAHSLAQNLGNFSWSTIRPLWLTISLLAAAAGLSWLAWRPMPVVVKPLILFLILGVLVGSAVLLFASHGLLIPVVWPSVLLAGLFTGVSILAWQRDNGERRFLRQAFSHYVSPSIVDAIVDDPESLRLGGERRIITCVFTDLAGFTELSENRSPEETTALLNEYLSQICEVFARHGATIDKIVGDSVVGFLGAPTAQENQAERAVALALDVDIVAEEYRTKLASEGTNLGITRVGVHMGPAIVGNIGGDRFFDYTAIGDTVNVASRLEGANRYLGTRLCVSAAVADAAPSHLQRPAGILFLKGKARGLEVHEPLQMGSVKETYLKEYQNAYRMMVMTEPGAADAFKKLLERHPEDGLLALHARRLAAGETGAMLRLHEK